MDLNHRPLGYEPNRVNDSITFQRLDAAGNDTESLKRHKSTVIGPQSDYKSAGRPVQRLQISCRGISPYQQPESAEKSQYGEVLSCIEILEILGTSRGHELRLMGCHSAASMKIGFCQLLS